MACSLGPSLGASLIFYAHEEKLADSAIFEFSHNFSENFLFILFSIIHTNSAKYRSFSEKTNRTEKSFEFCTLLTTSDCLCLQSKSNWIIINRARYEFPSSPYYLRSVIRVFLYVYLIRLVLIAPTGHCLQHVGNDCLHFPPPKRSPMNGNKKKADYTEKMFVWEIERMNERANETVESKV